MAKKYHIIEHGTTLSQKTFGKESMILNFFILNWTTFNKTALFILNIYKKILALVTLRFEKYSNYPECLALNPVCNILSQALPDKTDYIVIK